MYSLQTQSSSAQPSAERKPVGRVTSVDGASATVELTAPDPANPLHATVGKFLGVLNGQIITVGLITQVSEAQGGHRTAIAHIDLFGELRAVAGMPRFSRGVSEYPGIGEPAILMTSAELRLVYGSGGHTVAVGGLQQDASITAQVDIDELLTKHFAIVGTTGVGKSTGVAIILQKVLEARPDVRIFLVDPHNEYGRCFGDRAQVLNPRNLRLPFWLFNFEEIVDAFFGGRPGTDEEIEILSEAIPLAKAAYLQYRNTSDRALMKRRDPKTSGFTADTLAPYRLEDLVNLIDERMGKLENRSSRMHHYRLLQRIQTFRNHPRYAFMFENANVGGDTMAEIISGLFRLPANGKPMTVMQLAGFPAEVVDAVMSVLCRMAFDFGLWSDGVAPLLFVCEEAHRYAAADSKIGFGPTRRALSRIAKEGRKYGVYLGLVTQRPAEIDPNIISQCNTLFVMRLSNDRDQALIRSAVSDAASSLLTFLPSLGTGEVFVFGSGVALPMRMRFKEMPATMRPSSEIGGVRSDTGQGGMELIASVIERWRSSTMSQKNLDDLDYEAPLAAMAREDAPALQPQASAQPQAQMQMQQPSLDQRSRILKAPLDRAALGATDPSKSWR
jgi:DNA helicase HerA-like ATPase